jgi:hypothetical protein
MQGQRKDDLEAGVELNKPIQQIPLLLVKLFRILCPCWHPNKNQQQHIA